MKKDRNPQVLRPTVKRDLSLFSVKAWQFGYSKYLFKSLNWKYNIYFYYDGKKVNFYHTLKDFQYFKEEITVRIFNNKELFEKLNRDFVNNTRKLIEISEKDSSLPVLKKINSLIGKIMSFYIFVVSDTFTAHYPEALESRKLSEGILYLMDEKIEEYIKELLITQGYNPSISHTISLQELIQILDKTQRDKVKIEEINKRLNSYILFNRSLTTDINFKEYCRKHKLVNPEDEVIDNLTEAIKGVVAYKGSIVRGKARIIHNKKDLVNITTGDIIVSTMTNTLLSTYIDKVAAIVTDEGGILCHAAILAREFKTPCIVATRIATKIFKDGDILEVNTNEGYVKVI